MTAALVFPYKKCAKAIEKAKTLIVGLSGMFLAISANGDDGDGDDDDGDDGDDDDDDDDGDDNFRGEVRDLVVVEASREDMEEGGGE